MTDLDLLTAQLKLNPTALDLRMMWRDEYMNQNECTAADAKRECAAIWVPILDQYYEESACVLVHESGTVHANARWLLRRETPFPVPRTVRFAITRGFIAPCRPDEDARWQNAVIGVSYTAEGNHLLLHRVRERPLVTAVLLGSRWVIEFAKKHRLVWSYTSAVKVHEQHEERSSTYSTTYRPTDGDQAEEDEPGD